MKLHSKRVEKIGTDWMLFEETATWNSAESTLTFQLKSTSVLPKGKQVKNTLVSSVVSHLLHSFRV